MGRLSRLRADSGLAVIAPVGDAVGVALPARANRVAARGTGTARRPVDAPRAPSGFQGGAHDPLAVADEGRRLVGLEIAEPPPGAYARAKAGLRADRVADSGDHALVEQRVADLPGRARAPQTARRRFEFEVGTERVGAQLGEAGIVSQPRRRDDAEELAAELRARRATRGQQQPRATPRWRPAGPDSPSPVDAQVAVNRESVRERHQEVLPTSLGALEGAALELRGARADRRAR